MVDDKGEQTTVTRTVDGQTVRQTTIQKKNGEQETVEDLINMDESKWSMIFILLKSWLMCATLFFLLTITKTFVNDNYLFSLTKTKTITKIKLKRKRNYQNEIL